MGPARIVPTARSSVAFVSALIALMAIAVLALGMSPASAQSGDVEMSCAPESVVAGATTTCNVAGVAASTRATIEVRSAGTVVGQSSAIAGTDGRAVIAVVIPATTSPGQVTLALSGTTLTFDVTVTPGRPTGVSAGLSPSSGDVVRGAPLTLVAGLVLMLALLRTLPRRAPQD
jgi:hypothetical protein